MTADHRVRLDHPVVVADWPRVTAALDQVPPGDALVLIGRRHLASNNSWMHNSARLTRGTNECTVLISPHDAALRGIGDRDSVVVETALGAVEVEAVVTDEVMPGVVSMPHGWGHGRRGSVGWRHAATTQGESVNDIIGSDRFDPLSGNAAVTAVPVAVRRCPPPA